MSALRDGRFTGRAYPRALAAALSLLLQTSLTAQAPSAGAVWFEDDFEGDLSRWEITGESGVRVQPSGEPAHGRVLVLEPHGDVLALVKGSARLRGWRMEGEMRFPSGVDSYLGVAYNYQRRGDRTDFGLIYVKSPESYLQANPHRDFNVSRTLYPEYRAALTGPAAVRQGEWIRFAVEVVGADCHFYVGDMATPAMTFPLFELSSGAFGLQPRSVGAEVWVDNVRVTAIDVLTYRGPPRPAVQTTPAGEVLTTWQVHGPLTQTRDDVARFPDAGGASWAPFPTDSRGAVVSGRVVDYHGPQSVAYFRTRITVPAARQGMLHLSTIDDLAVWVNGRFHWFVPRAGAAWPDFTTHPKHAGQRIPLRLHAGVNDLVIRVRGGVYASGGFFAAFEPGAATTQGPR